jgi:hypothetical protein
MIITIEYLRRLTETLFCSNSDFFVRRASYSDPFVGQFLPRFVVS